ncbi:mCG1026015 [Mus musculus]|nr:mCG1026015 [Mus musculus]
MCSESFSAGQIHRHLCCSVGSDQSATLEGVRKEGL